MNLHILVIDTGEGGFYIEVFEKKEDLVEDLVRYVNDNWNTLPSVAGPIEDQECAYDMVQTYFEYSENESWSSKSYLVELKELPWVHPLRRSE